MSDAQWSKMTNCEKREALFKLYASNLNALFFKRKRHFCLSVLPEVIRAGFRDEGHSDGHSGELHAGEP